MKPALTIGITLVAALTGGCTKYLRIEPVQALTDQPGAPLKGVPYALYFDQFEIATTAKLIDCDTFKLEIGAELTSQTALPDPAFSYMIDPNSMAGLLHSSKFDIDYNPDGSIASVNAEVEDHTPAVALGLAKAAAGIITLEASGPIGTFAANTESTPTDKAIWAGPKLLPVKQPICSSDAARALKTFNDQKTVVEAAAAALDQAQKDFDDWNEQMDSAGSNPPPTLRRAFNDAYIRLRGAVQRQEAAQTKLDAAEKELVVSEKHFWPGSGVIGQSDNVDGAGLAAKARKAFINPEAILSKDEEKKLTFSFSFKIAPVGSSPYSTYPRPSNIPANVGHTGLPYRLPAKGQLVVQRITGTGSKELLNQPVTSRQLGRVMILPCTGRPLVKTGCSLNFDHGGVLTKAGTSVDGAGGEKIVDVLGGTVDAAEGPVKAIRDRDERRRTAAEDARKEQLASLKLDQELEAARQAKLDATGEQAVKQAQAEIEAIDRARSLLEARRKLREEQDKITAPES